MRGKDCTLIRLVLFAGITPACAGKSKSAQGPADSSGDHPRVCGEKFLQRFSILLYRGSPPRVRGKGPPGNDRAAHRGITPACAGKSGFSGVSASFRRDHPRVCGEKDVRTCKWTACPGSPPRVRGKVPGNDRMSNGCGITPACAGKSLLDTEKADPSKDHPRVCGEKSIPASSTGTSHGSPPRVRGKVPLSIECGFCTGITPACAGKRYGRARITSGYLDHPRVCGEKLLFVFCGLCRLGSPPRVRGKD